MAANDIVLTNEEIVFLKEGGQIVLSGFYNKEDVFNEHNVLSYLLLEKVLQEKNDIKDSENLELIYMDEENGNILAQWYNEETGIEYRKIQ